MAKVDATNSRNWDIFGVAQWGPGEEI
uniref:Uncharacterized protein n=1 Tax=Arundo donax TaxID=35708 RepID=A0A0A9BB29_ARUDO